MKFIKKFLERFQPEELPEVKIVYTIEWFDSQLKERFSKTKDKIESHLSEFESVLSEMQDKLTGLEDAKLHNPNIDHKEKQILKGNKQSYILKINQFLNNFPTVKSMEVDSLMRFCKNLDDKIEVLNKSTIRPYYVLQQFHANEAHKVAMSLKGVDRILKNIKDLLGNVDILEISDIRKEIEHLNNTEANINEKNGLIKRKKSLIKDFEKNIKQLNLENSEIKSGSDYKKYLDNKEEFAKTSSELSLKGQDFINEILPISKILKKYERSAIENSDMLKRYNNNAVNALINDENLVIIKIVGSINSRITSGNIDTKGKDNKMLEVTEHLIKIAPRYRMKLVSLNEKATQLKKELDEYEGINIIRKNLNKIKEIEQKVLILKSDISGIKEKLNKIDHKSIKDLARKKIARALKIKAHPDSR